MAVLTVITILATLQFLFFGFLVGKARARFGVHAPATTGHEAFERYFRVQMNTLEQLVMFLPALWLASPYIAPPWLVLLGLLYLVGRFLYLRGYVQAAHKRSLGFAISSAAILILSAIALIGSVIRIARAGWV